MRRDYRPNANIPPAVPEGEVLNLPQYPSANRPPYVSSERTVSYFYLKPICPCQGLLTRKLYRGADKFEGSNIQAE